MPRKGHVNNMRTLMIALLALSLAVAATPVEAHISNDPAAGGCPDDGSIHQHSYTGCYSFPGKATVEKLLERPA
jgi:hypothetical protein